jgi:hypothetical protein
MEISVVEHCDTDNGGAMLSPPPRLQLSTSWAGGVPRRSLPAPPRPNPYGAAPHHPALGPSACGELPPAPSAGGTQCFGPLQHASTATAKGGCAQCARSRVDDHVRCAVSLAELSAVSLGEP